jgi:hypothetical protein
MVLVTPPETVSITVEVLDQHRRRHPRSRASEGRASARSSSTRSLSTFTYLRSGTSGNDAGRWRADDADLHSPSPRLGGIFSSSLVHISLAISRTLKTVFIVS